MKRVRLSRSQRISLSKDTGELAEDIATAEYGYNRFISAAWYDGKRDTGAVCEVKSALSTLSNGATGRFRLWQAQHTKLVRKDRNGSARYLFVLFDVDDGTPTAYLKSKEPAWVGHQLGARGGWGPSGHDSRTLQHKLPIAAIFPEKG